MLSPAAIVNDLVSRLRKLDALVALCGGSPESIYAFHRRFPTEASLVAELANQAAGTILVAHQGSSVSGGTSWTHRVAVYFRPGEQSQQDPALAAAAMFNTMMTGTPNGESVELQYGDFTGSSALIESSFDYSTDENGQDYAIAVLNIQESGIGG